MDEPKIIIEFMELSISRQRSHLSQLQSSYFYFLIGTSFRVKTERQSRHSGAHPTNTVPENDIKDCCEFELSVLKNVEAHGLVTTHSLLRMRELENDPATALWMFQSEDPRLDMIRAMAWMTRLEEMDDSLGILDRLEQRLQEVRDEIFATPDYEVPEATEEFDLADRSTEYADGCSDNWLQFPRTELFSDAPIQTQWELQNFQLKDPLEPQPIYVPDDWEEQELDHSDEEDYSSDEDHSDEEDSWGDEGDWSNGPYFSEEDRPEFDRIANLFIAQGWVLLWNGDLIPSGREPQEGDESKSWFNDNTLGRENWGRDKRGNANIDVSLLKWLGWRCRIFESVDYERNIE